MTAEGEGTGTGTGEGTGEGTGKGDEGQGQSLGWRAGLPDPLKNHDAITPYKTVGDFAKVHIETVGKVKELEGKLASAIPRPGEKATDEEKAAYRKAIGVPDKPEDYELPKVEGIETPTKTEEWARKSFHKANLTKEQAKSVGTDWNEFMAGMVAEVDRIAVEQQKEADKKFRAEFKSDEEYNGAKEGVKRFWKKVSNTEFDTFCNETGIGNHPTLIKFIYEIAKKTGEDFSPKGGGQRGAEVKPGMIYDKTPGMMKT